MFPWQRREVLVTQSVEKYGRAQTALHDAKIAYATKIFDSGFNRGSRGMGRFAQRTEVQIFYYIYVRKADVERAKYLIGQI
jgi:hypothetical protein